MDGVALFRARCVADYKCFCYLRNRITNAMYMYRVRRLHT